MDTSSSGQGRTILELTPALPRRPWTAPLVIRLPKLTDLTLLSPIGGGGGTGGSTVFGLLLAAGLLFGIGACADQTLVNPRSGPQVQPIATIGCQANIATRAVTCAAPAAAPGQEIFGGQGVHVALRASNVAYDTVTQKFTFDATIQNLGSETIGTDGSSATGVRVFFVQAPQATSGSGAISVENDSIGTFTGLGQPYYIYPDSLATTVESSPVGWQFGVPSTATTFAFTVLVAAEVPDVGGILRFQKFGGLYLDSWGEIVANAANDAMAVGAAGATAHNDGTGWTKLPAPTSDNFTAVAPLGGGAYIAITDTTGDLYRFDGKIWTKVHSAPGFAPLRDIWASGPDFFVAVGLGGAVTYDHGAFADEAITGSPDLVNVSAVDTGAVYASSAFGSLYVRQGGSWLPGPQVLTSGTLAAFRQVDPGTFAWSVSAGSRLLVVASGGIFDTVAMTNDTLITGIYSDLSDTLYLAATTDLTDSTQHAVLLGALLDNPGAGVFGLSALPAQGFSAQINPDPGGGLWMSSHSSLTGDFSSILHWQGGSFATSDVVLADDYSAIWGTGNHVWITTASGKIWSILNGSLNPDLFGTPVFRSIWGVSANEIYAGAKFGILYQRDTTSGWTAVGGVGASYSINGLWADSATDLILTADSAGEIKQRSGGIWSTVASPTFHDLNGVWGCSGTEAWLVSQAGEVLHYVGGSIASDTTLGSGAPLRAVAGSSCTDVWVAGDGGAVFHWDGAHWTDFSTPAGDFFHSLRSRGPGAVYAGAANRVTLFTTGGARIQLSEPSGSNPLLGLWRTTNGDLYGVGSRSVVVGTR